MPNSEKPLIPYATTTRTERNIDAMRRAGWRLLLTPQISDAWDMPYALDNGAWSAFCTGQAFNENAFRALFDQHHRHADFVIVPDIVAAGLESLHFSLEWLDKLAQFDCLFLLAVQDGMQPQHVAPWIGKRVGLFVGGSTEWKLASLPSWGALAQECGVYLHVGRVNTARRIRYCSGFGVHSFDGTSVTRYAETLPLLDFTRRQRALDFERLES